MANIPAARLACLTQTLMCILRDHPEGLPKKDALQMLEEALPLTEYEKGCYPNGKRRFETIVGFTTGDFTGAGWLVKDENGWQITNDGLQALKDYPDAWKLRNTAHHLNKQWKKARQGKLIKEDVSEDSASDSSKTSLEDSEETIEQMVLESDESAGTFFQETQARAHQMISEYLGSMPPYVFQKLVSDLLRAMGYHVLWDADTPGPDGGVDIIACTDPLGMQTPRIKVQVKRQKAAVSMPDLKSFVANIGSRDAGIFVCTGGFTSEAEKYTRSLENRQLTIINQKQLLALWTAHSHKLDDQARQRLPLAPVYLLLPME